MSRLACLFVNFVEIPERGRKLIAAKVVDIVVQIISPAARCVVASGMLLVYVVYVVDLNYPRRGRDIFSQHCRDNPNYSLGRTILLCGLSPLHLATQLYLRTPPWP